MKIPLVSVVVATKNEEVNIRKCLESIKIQTYENIEMILVDNNSTDLTKEIARRYGAYVFNKGPERSAQRNFGAKKAKGDYLFFIDADMILTKNVISESVSVLTRDSSTGGIIIPEKSTGEGFWAKVKSYERSFYVGDDSVEAPRFFRKDVLNEVGGYDEHLIAGEDWDLRNRIGAKSKIGRVKSIILHNEGKSALLSILKKKFYYARFMHRYFDKYKNQNTSTVRFFIFRPAFYRKPQILLSHPMLTICMFALLTLEAIAGLVGLIVGENEK